MAKAKKIQFLNDGSQTGIAKVLITRAQAAKAIEAVEGTMTTREFAKLSVPSVPGLTTHLGPGVDMTKVRTPDMKTKSPLVLVGVASALTTFYNTVLLKEAKQ